MATDLENLKQIRSNYIEILLELSDPARRKPTYSIDGKVVSWNEYQSMIAKDLLPAISAQINSMEPYEYITHGYT